MKPTNYSIREIQKAPFFFSPSNKSIIQVIRATTNIYNKYKFVKHIAKLISILYIPTTIYAPQIYGTLTTIPLKIIFDNLFIAFPDILSKLKH